MHSFGGPADGFAANLGLTLDSSGNLYGTTSGGGTNGSGTVFELTPPVSGDAWSESVLYSFASEYPYSEMIRDKGGHLFGTTYSSATGADSIYRLSPPALTKTVWQFDELYSSPPAGGGFLPGLALNRGTSNFYGLTSPNPTYSCGTLYELAQPAVARGAWTYSTVHSLQSGGVIDGCTFDNGPYGLFVGADGTLFGVTFTGGASSRGTVFQVTPQ